MVLYDNFIGVQRIARFFFVKSFWNFWHFNKTALEHIKGLRSFKIQQIKNPGKILNNNSQWWQFFIGFLFSNNRDFLFQKIGKENNTNSAISCTLIISVFLFLFHEFLRHSDVQYSDLTEILC